MLDSPYERHRKYEERLHWKRRNAITRLLHTGYYDSGSGRLADGDFYEETYLEGFIDRILKYEKQVRYYRLVDIPLQLIIIVGAILVPALLAYPEERPTAATLSVIVAIAAALENRFRFGEHQRNAKKTMEAMIREQLTYEVMKDRYSGMTRGAAFRIFVKRVDEILREHDQTAITIEAEAKKATPTTPQTTQ